MKTGFLFMMVLAIVTMLVAGCSVPGAPSPTPTPGDSVPAPSAPTPSPAPTPAPVPSPTTSPAPTATGNEVNFRLLVSDEVIAIEEFEYFKINVTKFGVHQSGEGESDGWVEYDIDDKQVDLLDVLGLDAMEVWTGELEADTTYDKMFIYVGASEDTPAIDAKLNNSDEEPNVKLPSGKLHINKPFTTPPEGDAEPVNFVYDVTVVKAGKSGQYILKPQADESGADKNFNEISKGGKSGQAGKSNIGHLYLRQKDSDGADNDPETAEDNWSIVDKGAWGKLKYNLSGPTFDFVFNGHRLEQGIEYSLIYYADFEDRFNVWGGHNPGALIASGTPDEEGNIHLEDSIDLGMDLPHPDDANASYYNYKDPGDPPEFTGDGYANMHGAKIWLVPSEAYTEDPPPYQVISWEPDRFLFETDLITYDDTN